MGPPWGVLTCYFQNDDEDEPPPMCFPFHQDCFQLLERCITGSSPASPALHKLTLFEVMRGLLDRSVLHPYALNIDYGQPRPPIGQYWICHPGEEIFVAQPTATPRLLEHMRYTLSKEAFQLQLYAIVSPSLKDRDQPFSCLSYDILHQVVDFLPTRDIISLIVASPLARRLLLPNLTLWWGRINQDMPWFYELRQVITEIEDASGKRIDLRKVWSWAQIVSYPTQFMRGEYMGLANRRRIWTPCSILAALYYQRVPDNWDGASAQSESDSNWGSEDEYGEVHDDN